MKRQSSRADTKEIFLSPRKPSNSDWPSLYGSPFSLMTKPTGFHIASFTCPRNSNHKPKLAAQPPCLGWGTVNSRARTDMQGGREWPERRRHRKASQLRVGARRAGPDGLGHAGHLLPLYSPGLSPPLPHLANQESLFQDALPARGSSSLGLWPREHSVPPPRAAV